MAIIRGTQNSDTLNGTEGDDRILGFGGNDSLDGAKGNDVLDGGNGNDTLRGTTSIVDFTRVATNNIDTLNGGAGKDVFMVSATYDDLNPSTAGITDYSLFKDFQPSDDFIMLSGSTSNYFLAPSPAGLPQGTAIFYDKPGSEVDELIAIIENRSGLNLKDTYFTLDANQILNGFVGSPGVDRYDAGAGRDNLFGNGGDDILFGGAGDDYLNGNDGNDSLSGDAETDTINGNNGNDSLSGGSGNDRLAGGKGNDSLSGDSGDDTLCGAVTFGVPGVIITTPPDQPPSEVGEIDTLTGGDGIDKFLLVNTVLVGLDQKFYGPVYYDDGNNTTTGINDYALITDFNSSLDKIELKGTAANYILGSSPSDNPTGAGIYIDKPGTELDELIAIVQGVNSSSLSLTASYFSYVGSLT